MFCRKCGTKLIEDSNYCSHCGKKIDDINSLDFEKNENKEDTNSLNLNNNQKENQLRFQQNLKFYEEEGEYIEKEFEKHSEKKPWLKALGFILLILGILSLIGGLMNPSNANDSVVAGGYVLKLGFIIGGLYILSPNE